MILGIYGAGGLGREVYELALIINNAKNRWSEIIFIDDASSVDDLRKIPIHTFAEMKQSIVLDAIEVCIAIGEPSIRQLLYVKLLDNGVQIATLIHPEISMSDSTKIGKGAIICRYVSITCDIHVGNNVYIHPMACIGHDAHIGDHSMISSFVDVAGDCVVGEKVFLAIGVVLKQGVSIGANSIVGLSSVVYRDLPESVIALGNPARPMKKNESERVFK